MKKRIRILMMVAMASATYCTRVSADIVVDHQPHNYGGPASDTEFYLGSNLVWQRLADDFRLSEAASIEKFVWWGFYDRDNPSATETMRIRVYRARPEDGLPDEVASYYEESFLNPTREATGRFIYVGIYPDEYRYEASLSEPLALEAETDYWVEIIQIGDPSTVYRWEDSITQLNGHAFTNGFVGDWQHTMFDTGSLAFQLIAVPEPSVIVMMAFGMSFLVKRVRP